MNKAENADVLIVGQGLAGTLLSYQLYKKKISHKVIDLPKEGSASRVAAGLINPIVVKRVTKAWQADLFFTYASQLYQELELFLNTRFFYPMPINKLYGKDDEVFWQQRNKKEGLDDDISVGPHYDLPDGINQPYGYGTIKRSARLDMVTLLDSYRQFLVTKSMVIETEFNDEELELSDNGLLWNSIQAKQIVFCRGSFDGQSRFFRHLKWSNTKGELLDVRVNDLRLNAIVSKGIFVMPAGNNCFKVGATYAHHWSGLTPTEEKCKELLEKWKVISDLSPIINKQLTGIRPTMADRRPLATFLSEYPQIGLLNGLGSRGGLMAPYLAKEMIGRMTL